MMHDTYNIIHAGPAVVSVWVRSSVTVCVRDVKEKRLELRTRNLVDTRHALTLRSKGQMSRSCGYQTPVWEC